MKLLTTIALALALQGCSQRIMNTNQGPYTYLALGDSYTIGESVNGEDNFPNQLARELNNIKAPAIIARTGWTTDELIEAINTSDLKDKKYDIVTLLIGVNNQYRGYGKDTYRVQFAQLLNTAIYLASGDKARVFVLSVPDWGVTPFASDQDRTRIAADIDGFNAINKQETERAGAAYIDITAISRQAASDTSLNADDGLHPSARMYAMWVQLLAPLVNVVLK